MRHQVGTLQLVRLAIRRIEQIDKLFHYPITIALSICYGLSLLLESRTPLAMKQDSLLKKGETFLC